MIAFPEVSAGDDLGALVWARVGRDLRDSDIVAVTSKIVSKTRSHAAAARLVGDDGQRAQQPAQRVGDRVAAPLRPAG